MSVGQLLKYKTRLRAAAARGAAAHPPPALSPMSLSSGQLPILERSQRDLVHFRLFHPCLPVFIRG